MTTLEDMEVQKPQEKQGFFLGYCVLNNGNDRTILFPHVPLVSDVKFTGKDNIELVTPKGSVFLGDIQSDIVEALKTPKGLLLVGIDALIRPAFNARLHAAETCTISRHSNAYDPEAAKIALEDFINQSKESKLFDVTAVRSGELSHVAAFLSKVDTLLAQAFPDVSLEASIAENSAEGAVQIRCATNGQNVGLQNPDHFGRHVALVSELSLAHWDQIQEQIRLSSGGDENKANMMFFSVLHDVGQNVFSSSMKNSPGHGSGLVGAAALQVKKIPSKCVGGADSVFSKSFSDSYAALARAELDGVQAAKSMIDSVLPARTEDSKPDSLSLQTDSYDTHVALIYAKRYLEENENRLAPTGELQLAPSGVSTAFDLASRGTGAWLLRHGVTLKVAMGFAKVVRDVAGAVSGMDARLSASPGHKSPKRNGRPSPT